MENTYEIAAVPVIVVIVYVFMAIYRKIVDGKAEVWTNLTPLWAGLLGAVLGIVGYWAAPDLVPADNFVVALAVGLVSGLGATGINQIGKQLKKLDTSSTSAQSNVTEEKKQDTTETATKTNTETK